MSESSATSLYPQVPKSPPYSKASPTSSSSIPALRTWQREALGLYLEQLGRNEKIALWEATPGAGKTTAALRLCRHQLRHCNAKRLIIVVPTAHLKHQWAHAAKQLGVDLDSSFRSNAQRISPDYHGVAVTYQQVANAARKFSAFAQQAVVVLDEIHHAGDGLSWGDGLTAAFQEAQFLLALSGTPFRSDNNPIPFVRYSSDGYSEPNYVYGYGDAVKDGVCRPIAFLTYGGSVSWTSGQAELTADFSDQLDRDNAASRLRAALDPESGWIERMLQDANNMLRDLRAAKPETGGLIVCRNQDHARLIGRMIHRISGQKPVIVLSDDNRASRKIAEFRTSRDPWIIACNMVSEGVDIPRLSLGVFATVIQTKMYFRQFLGRVVRKSSGPTTDEMAYCYIPADPTLTIHAEAIDEEQRHFLYKPLAEEDRRERSESQSEPKEFTAYAGVNTGIDRMILDGNQVSLRDYGYDIESSPFDEQDPIPTADSSLPGEEGLTKSERKLQLAREVQKLVSMYHHRTKIERPRINAELNRRQSVKTQ
ncbi:MAG: DEAD/DEAH box helicase family protein, partial [Bdellovibrionales bacterium]|nr:DEAD/DEAH box helicase family protein [Bdellovibrionales bacterium]